MKQKPTVYLGADHGGYALKESLEAKLRETGYPVTDLGDSTLDSGDDYPVFAAAVAGAVAADLRTGTVSFGILTCRSSLGMEITANKFRGVRAVDAADTATAEKARQHNDANVLALAGDKLEATEAFAITEAFLTAMPADEDRHARRREEINRVETAHPEIIPGVFESDPSVVKSRLDQLASISDRVHLDVADGKLVPATALPDPSDATEISWDGMIELHLMVERPADYVESWYAVGARRFIGQLESPGFAELVESAAQYEEAEVLAGLDVGTPAEQTIDYLDQVAGVQFMTVKMGKSAQPFVGSVLEDIVRFHEDHPEVILAADGGVSDRTAGALVTAGVTRLVATSYISNAKDPAAAIELLKNPTGGTSA